MLVLQESPTTQPAPSPGSGPSFHEELIIKEARRRQRRRRGLVAAGALVIALGATALAVRTGSHGTTPPSGGNSAFEGLIAPTTPAGAKQVSSRSIDGWTLRIYASSSGLALDKVQVNYELIDPRGSVQGGGGGTLGLALSSGVVLTGSSGGGQWTVNEFVVTNPDVEGTRLVAGGKILDSMVRLTVKDNGVGIEPGDITRIFAQGFTTRKGGHGFGLHSAANAAQAMHGSLTAHSEGLGTGASFVLELPVSQSSNARESIERRYVAGVPG